MKSLRAEPQMCGLSVKWKERSPVVSIFHLRAVVFKACGSTDPMRVGRSAGRIFAQMQWIVSMSLPSYPSVWLHPCRARCCSTWLNHCTRIVIREAILQQPAGAELALSRGVPCGYGGHDAPAQGATKNALDRHAPAVECHEQISFGTVRSHCPFIDACSNEVPQSEAKGRWQCPQREAREVSIPVDYERPHLVH